MTNGYVWARRQPASRLELVALLNKLTKDWTISAYRYQERLDAVELDRADSEWSETLNQSPTALWPHGRVFCEEFELRWQTGGFQTEAYQLQVITEQALEWPAAEWSVEKFEVGAEYSTYLWGERKEEDLFWTATRIPRGQTYPVDWTADKTVAALWVQDYRQKSLTRLTRLVRVEAVSKLKE